jgi:hypothetical protein
MSATARWEKLVGELVAKGFLIHQAKSMVNRDNPGLRQAYLSEFHRAGDPLVSARWAQEAADCGYRAD